LLSGRPPALARISRDHIVATYGGDLPSAVACLDNKLMYAALIGAAERWCGIKITEFDRRQLKAISLELDRAHAERTVPAVTANITAPQSRLSSKNRT
jgi:hypothetical protein